MKTFITLTSTMVLSLIAVNAAHASDSAAPKSLTVQFADLDLNKPEGAATLFGRMRGAAHAVCSAHRGQSLQEKQRYATCVEFALSNAVATVDQPVLTQYVANRSSGKPKAPVQIASGR